MNIHADKTQINKSKSVSNAVMQNESFKSTVQKVDIRPEAISQRKVQEMISSSSQVKQLRAYQTMFDNHTSKIAQRKQSLEEESLQGKFEPVQKKENKTGHVYQLKKTKVDVTGITHTVRPLGEEELSIKDEYLISAKKHFTYNEVQELSEPDKVWIETADVILSRRGPNQEVFQVEDLSGSKYYAWYRILDGIDRPGDKTNEFLREDTFNLLPKQIPGREDGLTAKADVNSLRLGAETLIAKHYPIPMSKTSVGKVFIDTPADYQEFAVRYFEATSGEKYDKVTHEEVIKKIAKTNALTELGEIHINASKADFGTFIHELIHFYGKQDEFIASVCAGVSDGFNEGVTEYFARKVTAAEKIDRSGKYSKEEGYINVVVKVIGEQALYEAYFLGKNGRLIDLLKENKLWPVNG